MKKALLSSTILLAAGTALANATSLSDALLYTYEDYVYTVSATASAGAVSWTLVLDKSTLSSALSSLESGYLTYARLNSATGTVVGAYYYSTSESSNAGYTTGYWSSSAWTTGGYSSCSLAEAISTYAGDSDVVYLTFTTGATAGATLYVNGTSIYNASDLKSTSSSNFLYSVTVASGIASAITGFYAFSAELSAAEVSSINAEIAAVPEPSAFGLLAGLGALALVASRRRRSRKVVA